MRRLSHFLAGLAVAVALASEPARAQDSGPQAAEARQQYQLGSQAFQGKRYAEAALHFESAAAFRPHAVALYTAGLAWDNAGKPERAADAYARAVDVPGLDAKQAATARDRVEKIERTVGTVVVSAPDGWKVQLDTFTEVPTPARLHGAPGPHALNVRAVGRPVERRDVILEVGKPTVVDFREPKPAPRPPEVPPPPPVAPPPVSPSLQPQSVLPPAPVVVNESPWTLRRSIGFGVAGVGVAALGAAVVFGINANSAADAYSAGPTREAFDHASSLETWTNIALIGGAVLAAGGVALIVWPTSDAHVRVGVAPGGATLRGTF